MKILKKVLIGVLISSCLFFCFYQYKSTISTLEDDVALLELRNASLSRRLELLDNSLQKMGSSFANEFIKQIVQIENIKKGYSFIQTNAGFMTIFCKEEPKKSNSYVGKFLIGNPNNYVAKEITISFSFLTDKNSEIETKKYYITKDLYPGSWTEISVRADELSSKKQNKKGESPIIELTINRVEFKGELEKMTKVLELMQLRKSM
jgi:hypothetical protein